MTRSALVLGAGMVGTCTALHLAFRGYEVTLVDRREPGRETSYGNAGIIQREAVEPYAFPRGIPALLSAAFKRGADVNYHLGALPRLAAPLLRYWANSGPARYPAIARDYARLTEHATSEHARLIDAAVCAYEQAGLSGLCHEGRWECALAALRRTPLPAITVPD